MSDFVIENGKLLRYTGPGGDVTLPEGITEIEQKAFARCETLKTVTLNPGLTQIGNKAFEECRNLTAVRFPDSLEYIMWRAFARCENLQELTFPEGLKTISVGAFAGCTSLTAIAIPGNARVLSNAFAGCTGIEDIRIAGGLGYFLEEAFPIGRNLKWIENLREDSMFQGCGKDMKMDSLCCLEGGFLPYEKLAKLTPYCKKLAVICYLSSRDRYSPKMQAQYEDYIRKQASRLLPALIADGNQTHIHRLLATGTVGHNAIVSALEQTADPELRSALLDYQGKHIDLPKAQQAEEARQLRKLTHVETSTEVLKKRWGTQKNPDGTLQIISYKGTEEADLVVPAKIGKSLVTAIAENAFSPETGTACKNRKWRETGIRTITIPEGVTKIGNAAFCNCRALTAVTLPDSLREIGCSAFEGCTALTSIAIPQGITVLHHSLFRGCTGLTGVTLPEFLIHIHAYAFRGCTGLTAIDLPPHLMTLAGQVFEGCKALDRVHLPEHLCQIGCKVLDDTPWFARETEWEDGLCYAGPYLLTADRTAVPTCCTLRPGTRVIADFAFYNAEHMTRVRLSDGLRTVGAYAFAQCQSLTEAVLPEGVTAIHTAAFDSCQALTTLSIPASVTTIESAYQAPTPFEKCPSLTVRTPAGSFAEAYARERNISVEVME